MRPNFPSFQRIVPFKTLGILGNATESSKNTRRIEAKVDTFQGLPPALKLAHLKQLSAGLEGFGTANVDADTRAAYLHTVYRAENRFLNQAVGAGFGNLRDATGQEVDVNLDVGFKDNGWTRTTEAAYSTVYIRLQQYAQALLDKKNDPNAASQAGVGALDADIAEQYARIQKLLEKIAADGAVMARGWMPADPVRAMPTKETFKAAQAASQEHQWWNDGSSGTGSPSWRDIGPQEADIYDKTVEIFNGIQANPALSQQEKYQFFSLALAHLQNRDLGALPYVVPRNEAANAELLKARKALDAQRPGLKASQELCQFFCQNAERALQVSAIHAGLQAKADTQRAIATRSKIRCEDCTDKANTTIAEFAAAASDAAPSDGDAVSVAKDETLKRSNVASTRLRINVDLKSAHATEAKQLFADLCKRIANAAGTGTADPLQPVACLEIDNDVLQGVWPTDGGNTTFEKNQITVSFKAGASQKEIFAAGQALERLVRNLLDDHHRTESIGDDLIFNHDNKPYVSEIVNAVTSRGFDVDAYIKNNKHITHPKLAAATLVKHGKQLPGELELQFSAGERFALRPEGKPIPASAWAAFKNYLRKIIEQMGDMAHEKITEKLDAIFAAENAHILAEMYREDDEVVEEEKK